MYRGKRNESPWLFFRIIIEFYEKRDIKRHFHNQQMIGSMYNVHKFFLFWKLIVFYPKHNTMSGKRNLRKTQRKTDELINCVDNVISESFGLLVGWTQPKNGWPINVQCSVRPQFVSAEQESSTPRKSRRCRYWWLATTCSRLIVRRFN